MHCIDQVTQVSAKPVKLPDRETEDAMTGKKPKEQIRKGQGIQPATAQGPPPKITPETANPTPWSPKESEKG